ncbi:MAG: phytanoyl-CoA dioxygenase family protein [Bacteroidia bacterium]|nr:phytanoyl-CoA dioxygenase family protein [Bacteroidia bacterium]
MCPVFKNPIHQHQFELDGYIVVPDFLLPQDIEHLTRNYYELKDISDVGVGFHSTSHSKNLAYKRAVNQSIQEIFMPKAHLLIHDYQPLVANYTVKEPGQASFFDFHLDWSMVNEREHTSLTIWTPLVDVNATNGNLWVLRGSHKLGYTLRGGPGLFLFASDEVNQPLAPKFEKVVMALRAGTAVIYDHRLFHGSPPNLSGERRLAINQTLCPAATQSWHYHQLSDSLLEVFEVDPDFYCRYDMGTRPSDVKSLGTLRIEPRFLGQEEVNGLIRGERVFEGEGKIPPFS